MVTAARPSALPTLNTKSFPPPAQSSRLVSVDVLRGLVMVIMALDHTRDFLTYQRFAPEDVTHHQRGAFLYPLHHSLLRAGIRFSGWNGCVPRHSARKVIATGVPFLLDSWAVAGISGVHGRRLRVGVCPLGAWRSDLDFRLEHGCDGVDRAASAALDRGAGIGHDRHSQSSRSY